MDDHKIIFRPDVPTETAALARWLQEWHKQHNGIEPRDRLPNFILTKKGKQFIAMSNQCIELWQYD